MVPTAGTRKEWLIVLPGEREKDFLLPTHGASAACRNWIIHSTSFFFRECRGSTNGGENEATHQQKMPVARHVLDSAPATLSLAFIQHAPSISFIILIGQWTWPGDTSEILLLRVFRRSFRIIEFARTQKKKKRFVQPLGTQDKRQDDDDDENGSLSALLSLHDMHPYIIPRDSLLLLISVEQNSFTVGITHRRRVRKCFIPPSFFSSKHNGSVYPGSNDQTTLCPFVMERWEILRNCSDEAMCVSFITSEARRIRMRIRGKYTP